MLKYRRYELATYPSADFPNDLSCFKLVEAIMDPASLQKDHLLIRLQYVSIDPLLRVWISGAKSYLDPVIPGQLIPGFALGIVLYTQSSKFQVGDWVFGMLCWSELLMLPVSKVQKVPVKIDHMYKFLSIYGPTGLTAYTSIKKEIEPFAMDNNTNKSMTIVISSAAGGMGLMLISYLTTMGYTNVYGIAGSEQKCFIAQQKGYKEVLNYKKFQSKNQFDEYGFITALRAMIKDQINIYYDNVGEQMLTSIFPLMANHSKIILCGATATLNNWKSKAGIYNYEQVIMKRIMIQGILYFNLPVKEMMKNMIEMLSLNVDGIQQLLSGITALPEAYRDTIAGKYIGKTIVELV